MGALGAGGAHEGRRRDPVTSVEAYSGGRSRSYPNKSPTRMRL